MNMEELMSQAAEMQKKVAAAQETLATTTVKGIAPDGACIAEMTGRYDLLKITLNPDIIAKGSDAVTAAFMAAYNDAKAKADDLINRVMGAATAGMPMPE